MNLFIISDIHGNNTRLEQTLNNYNKDTYSHILILGDILNHGPRNPITEGYDPIKVAEILNNYSKDIICIQGNCDSEVDQMLLNFPIMTKFQSLVDMNRRFFLEHGHHFTEKEMPPLNSGDVYLYGHTHIPKIELKDEIYIINPGSITLPKEKHPATFATIENNHVAIRTLDGKIYLEKYLN